MLKYVDVNKILKTIKKKKTIQVTLIELYIDKNRHPNIKKKHKLMSLRCYRLLSRK